MLDVVGILFSSVMMLLIIVRAVKLDRIQPWFQTIKQANETPPGRQSRRHMRS